ncbi:MAG: hypothetical protein P1V20_26980 [Verrucomicrobiales bacterium]|nr:hypothetical protein [Verrucomicrobiales bacterium]
MKIEKLSSVAPRNQEKSSSHHDFPGYSTSRQSYSKDGFVYSVRDLLCIEHHADLPLDRCIKSDRPADRTVEIQLRSPGRPETWWGECPHRLLIGLSESEFQKHRWLTVLARSGVLLAATAIVCGVFLNPWLCLAGVVLFFASGLFHSIQPVWCFDSSQEYIAVKGVARGFRQQFSAINRAECVPVDYSAQVAGPHR